jgi:hypothetical protein
MNCSIVARLATSLVLLASGCGHQNGTAGQAQSASAETRRIAPEELKAVMPPRLQGPDGPYANGDSTKPKTSALRTQP